MMRLRSRMPQSMQTLGKSLESGVSAEGHRLAARRELKRTHVSHARKSPLGCKAAHRSAREQSRLLSARLIPSDMPQGTRLLRNAYRRRTRKPTGTDPGPATSHRQFDFLSRGPVRETSHVAMWMLRGDLYYRRNFPS